MFTRVASKLLTGPLAFLVAGTLDLLGYWLGAGWRALRARGLVRPGRCPPGVSL
jgi:hypothetical protein